MHSRHICSAPNFRGIGSGSHERSTAAFIFFGRGGARSLTLNVLKSRPPERNYYINYFLWFWKAVGRDVQKWEADILTKPAAGWGQSVRPPTSQTHAVIHPRTHTQQIHNRKKPEEMHLDWTLSTKPAPCTNAVDSTLNMIAENVMALSCWVTSDCLCTVQHSDISPAFFSQPAHIFQVWEKLRSAPVWLSSNWFRNHSTTFCLFGWKCHIMILQGTSVWQSKFSPALRCVTVSLEEFTFIPKIVESVFECVYETSE